MDQTPSTIFFGGTQLHDAITLTPSPLSAHYSDQLAGYFFILRLQNRVQTLTAPPGSGRAGQQQWQVWSDLQSADGHPFSRSPVHNSPTLRAASPWMCQPCGSLPSSSSTRARSTRWPSRPVRNQSMVASCGSRSPGKFQSGSQLISTSCWIPTGVTCTGLISAQVSP